MKHFLSIGLVFGSYLCHSQIVEPDWWVTTSKLGDDCIDDMEIYPNGDVLVLGYFSGTEDFNPAFATANLTSTGMEDVFIAKYSAEGDFIWAKSFLGPDSDMPMALSIAPDGNFYILINTLDYVDMDAGPGSYPLSGSLNQCILGKYTPDGELIWAIQCDFNASSNNSGMCVDPDGSVYITGNFMGTVDFNAGTGTNTETSIGSDDIFIVKYDDDGMYYWSKRIGGPDVDMGVSVHYKYGSVYLAGQFSNTVDFDPSAGTYYYSSEGNLDCFIVKMNGDGLFAWSKVFGGTSMDLLEHLVITDDEIAITGRFGGAVDFNPGPGTANLTSVGVVDQYILKLDTGGTFLWAKKFGGTGVFECGGMDISDHGEIYLAGLCYDEVNFSTGTTGIFSTLSNASGFAEYTSTGDLIWVDEMYATGSATPTDVGVTGEGAALFAGRFFGTADFDLLSGESLVSSGYVGYSAAFLLKLQPGNVSITEGEIKSDVLYPNPALGQVYVRLSSRTEIQIVDQIGQEVFEGNFESGEHEIDLTAIASGIYFVHIHTEDSEQVIKLVKN